MLPLSLYIHIPWCIQKCFYCDFNSHQKSKNPLPEMDYVYALLEDFKHDYETQYQPILNGKSLEIQTIFIGGGTPSLFSAHAFEVLMNGLSHYFKIDAVKEVTIEANPNSSDLSRLSAYRSLGINRVSLGIQSFDARYLKQLGRIHNPSEALHAIEAARTAGFDNINLDLMYALPNQSTHEAIEDLAMLIQQRPDHISWYQLTLEPNTVFYNTRPTTPNQDQVAEIENTGHQLLLDHNYAAYEISAFTQNKPCQHNLNYWRFGDYIGIGAGAHSKLTHPKTKAICRTKKRQQPKAYLDPDKPFIAEQYLISESDALFEFMLNTTRLHEPIPYALFEQQTGLNPRDWRTLLKQAKEKKLIDCHETHWQKSAFGRQFTNDLQSIFLP